MKCPLCIHPPNFIKESTYTNHLYKKHKVDKHIIHGLWINVLQVCPHCDAIIPSSCIGCLNCGKMITK